MLDTLAKLRTGLEQKMMGGMKVRDTLLSLRVVSSYRTPVIIPVDHKGMEREEALIKDNVSLGTFVIEL